MARFSADTVERVKDAADIVEVVSAYTDLRRAGRALRGALPVPRRADAVVLGQPRAEGSTTASAARPAATSIRFVQEKEGLEFPEAVESLAERYGVELEREEEDPKAGGGAAASGRGSYEVLERTAEFYETLPVGRAEGGEGAGVPARSAG